ALQLSGLDSAAGYSLLAQRGIAAQGDAESQLIERYSGNPLALKLVADTVDEIFEGNIGEFLAGESMVFGDVRDLLDQHFARLTPLEQEVLFWLAIVREPIDPPALRSHLLQAPANRNLLEALNSLQRRSLIERQADGFALQNVITEYLTDRLVGRALAELTEGKLDLLHRHPLLMAEAKEYVRESQVRLLVQPVAQQIVSHLSIGEIKLRCQQLLDRLRSQGPRRPSYAGGTILNLLLYLHAVVWRTMPTPYSLASCDFSKLALRQAHLRGAMLPAINFAESDLAHSTFTQAFGLATALAVSRDGQLLAAGGSGNEINIWQLSDYQPLRTLKGNLYNVSAVAFSPDGNLVACVTMHGAVYTWDVQSGRQLWSTEVSKSALYCVTFSPDGRALVASGHGPYIHFWESRHATWYRRLYSEPDTGAFVVAFHPHRPLLAVTSSSGNIFLV
ncbi:MAG: hypothetical protein KDE53_38890, partial [Caldilineaceae bacterium]|nr:hypothetical protein [Caldilineaceae bacterium]